MHHTVIYGELMIGNSCFFSPNDKNTAVNHLFNGFPEYIGRFIIISNRYKPRQRGK